MGSDNGQAKLLEEDVLSIRVDLRTNREVAATFGISRSHVSKLKRRRRWGMVVMQHRYQFQINGKGMAPVRDTWEDAFEDAEKAGYGKKLDASEHIMLGEEAKIVRYRNEGACVPATDSPGSPQ